MNKRLLARLRAARPFDAGRLRYRDVALRGVQPKGRLPQPGVVLTNLFGGDELVKDPGSALSS
ncbi:hypothetical protein SCD90_09030 [Terrihabitans sp. PJ23]|uniref:Uncharacterized protein n=1 Tax=Terrihabitans rhizophilus TaxID=3092662 RepID=A0ABU4RN15_9HYPH|nr:hypothetical protein [Terrihabitans sp. PJ23]